MARVITPGRWNSPKSETQKSFWHSKKVRRSNSFMARERCGGLRNQNSSLTHPRTRLKGSAVKERFHDPSTTVGWLCRCDSHKNGISDLFWCRFLWCSSSSVSRRFSCFWRDFSCVYPSLSQICNDGEKMETLDMSRSLLSRRDFVCLVLLVSTPSFISCLTLMDFLLPAQATHDKKTWCKSSLGSSA